MGLQFEASRLSNYFPPAFRRLVKGTVVSVYITVDDTSNAKRRAVPTTELSSDERANAGLPERELWFRIIQDGQLCTSLKDIQQLRLSIKEPVVNKFGHFTILPTDHESMVFLNLFIGHLRSASIFQTALTHYKSQTAASQHHFSQVLKEQWLGEQSPRARPTNPELWVDLHADRKNADELPLMFVGSSAHRLVSKTQPSVPLQYSLISRELWNTSSRNIKATLWESFYLENLIRAYGGLSEGIEENTLCTAHGSSPFSYWFSEMILSSIVGMKSTERCVFDINHMMRSVSIEAVQVGGGVDRFMFDLNFGGRIRRNLILTTCVDSDPSYTMLGRLSPTFCRGPSLRAELTCISKIAQAFDELDLIEIIRSTFLDANSLITTLFIPLGIPEVISVILLTQLLSLTIPILRDKASVLVASSNATLISNTSRLLIDSLAPEIRDMFITTKTYLISGLLDGFKKKTAYYLESLTQLDERLSAIKTPFRIIISTPESIEEGWSKEIFTRFIRDDPGARVVLKASPSSSIYQITPMPLNGTTKVTNLMKEQVYQHLNSSLPSLYFEQDLHTNDMSTRPEDTALNLDNVNGFTALRQSVDLVFQNLKNDSTAYAAKANPIKSFTVWEEIPWKGNFTSFDRAFHLMTLSEKFAADDQPRCSFAVQDYSEKVDGIDFTKSLIRSPLFYHESLSLIATPHLEVVNLPVNVQGIDVVNASIEPARVRLSSKPISEMNDGPTPASKDAPAVSAGDDWLLGLLKNLGEAVQEMKSDSNQTAAAAAARRVARRSAIDSNLNKLFCSLLPKKETSLVIADLPNCDHLSNQVYMKIMNTLNLTKTEQPVLSVSCAAGDQCFGTACKNMHHIRIQSNGFGLVQLGILRELTRQKLV